MSPGAANPVEYASAFLEVGKPFHPLSLAHIEEPSNTNPPASAIHEASRPSKKKPPMAIITTSLTRFNFLVSDSMLVGPIHTVLKLPDDTDCQTDAPTLIAFV
ncbi:hypothetical protein HZS61_017352 [Fusarium oxysporum f. sp. conglutinans]|uniref:Uncharacterized protein n=1 Tax=Fusarium oxysporum f. sp. conglutinans TaxID=100902 RepID=A0A8H6GIZ9_FUSOX|nr:hypothetical protein HZS61_017352 [Fusarium oxysporum f. sp. conglutinans]